MRLLAQLSINKTPIPQPAHLPVFNLRDIIQSGINIAIIAGILLALFMLILTGYQYMTSGGDKETLHKARMRFIYIIIGLVLMFLAILIVTTIGRFFGVSLLGN